MNKIFKRISVLSATVLMSLSMNMSAFAKA